MAVEQSNLVNVPVFLPKGAGFKDLYRRFGKKEQYNLPLTQPLLDIVKAKGGSEFILKLIIEALHAGEDLPPGYEVLLNFNVPQSSQ